MKRNEGSLNFSPGHDHRDFDAVRATQALIDAARCEEAPRHSVWTLGCRLRRLRVPEESTATASTRTLKLITMGGQLIRGSLTGAEDAEPLISAFAQGVVLGFYRLAQIDVSYALEGVGFWRRCELASIHQVGVDGGQRIRAQHERSPAR